MNYEETKKKFFEKITDQSEMSDRDKELSWTSFSIGWDMAVDTRAMPKAKMTYTKKEAIDVLLNDHHIDLGNNPGRYLRTLQEKGLLPAPCGVRKQANTYHAYEIIPRILEIKQRQRGGATLKQIKKHFDEEGDGRQGQAIFDRAGYGC